MMNFKRTEKICFRDVQVELLQSIRETVKFWLWFQSLIILWTS